MEAKTFGELTIGDRFYVFCKSNNNNFCLIAGTLKKSENKRNHIQVEDDDNETTDLPCDESRYEDEYYIYTTDSKEYDKWQIPRWEKEIKQKDGKILFIKNEIQELRSKIDKANLAEITTSTQ